MSISMRSGGWCRRLSEANPDMASRLAATATPSLPWSGPPAARAVRRARDGEHRADNVIIHEYGRIADAPATPRLRDQSGSPPSSPTAAPVNPSVHTVKAYCQDLDAIATLIAAALTRATCPGCPWTTSRRALCARRSRSHAVDCVESTWHANLWTRGAYSPTLGLGGLVRFGPDMRRASARCTSPARTSPGSA